MNKPLLAMMTVQLPDADYLKGDTRAEKITSLQRMLETYYVALEQRIIEEMERRNWIPTKEEEYGPNREIEYFSKKEVNPERWQPTRYEQWEEGYTEALHDLLDFIDEEDIETGKRMEARIEQLAQDKLNLELEDL